MAEKIAILDYDAGNLTSVLGAVKHLGRDAVVTRELAEIEAADRVIFPGVGAAGSAMESLKRLGLADAIREAFRRQVPILGICIGCQVIFEESEEDGGTPCLGLVPGKVVRFRFPPGIHRKVPHMGWNQVEFKRDPSGASHRVFEGIESGSEFYFVHSYHAAPATSDDVQGASTYGEVEFTAAVAHKNLVAVQFHTEKSGRCGLQVLENFLNWDPSAL